MRGWVTREILKVSCSRGVVGGAVRGFPRVARLRDFRGRLAGGVLWGWVTYRVSKVSCLRGCRRWAGRGVSRAHCWRGAEGGAAEGFSERSTRRGGWFRGAATPLMQILSCVLWKAVVRARLHSGAVGAREMPAGEREERVGQAVSSGENYLTRGEGDGLRFERGAVAPLHCFSLREAPSGWRGGVSTFLHESIRFERGGQCWEARTEASCCTVFSGRA